VDDGSQDLKALNIQFLLCSRRRHGKPDLLGRYSGEKTTMLLYINLMKGKALRKHSLHEKTAASVL